LSVFRQKVAVITGAASGIGLSLSRLLAEKGAIVVMTDLAHEKLEASASQLRKEGHTIHAHPLNVVHEAATKALMHRLVEELGQIDYLFNNAGIGIGGEARDFSSKEWNQVIDVNLRGTINGILAVYPLMLERKSGHIVNVASVAGLIPLAGEISYTASKYAVVGLSHTLRAEAADLGVKVSVVCPGKIETPIYKTSEILRFDREKVLALWPKGITPEQCARVILRGVAKNQATIVVTKLAKLLWTLQRCSPNLMIWLFKKYMRKMREHRLDTTSENENN